VAKPATDRTIWKFALPVTDEVTLPIPTGGQFLKADVQQGVPCLWVLVDPTARKVLCHFRIFGTGQPIAADEIVGLRYIDTFQTENGSLVHHLFVRRDD
jgi:hypothetical protein